MSASVETKQAALSLADEAEVRDANPAGIPCITEDSYGVALAGSVAHPSGSSLPLCVSHCN